MNHAIEIQQTAQVVFGVERIRPGAGDSPEERADNGEVLESLEFPNLILDVGLDALFDNSLRNMMMECHVGSGTAEPAFTDEGLATEVASTTNFGSTANIDTGGNTSPLYGYHTRRFTFGEGQAEGNLTEVGLSNDAATPIFLNRQLFRDGNGDPVTVTIASDEILRIHAEGRWYSDIQTDESTTGSFTYKGDTVDFTRAVNGTGTWTADNNNPVRSPRGGQLSADSWGLYDGSDVVRPQEDIAVSAYTSGDHKAVYTLVWTAGDLNGTYTELWYENGAYKFSFTPGLAVDSTEELTLTVTLRWGRNP